VRSSVGVAAPAYFLLELHLRYEDAVPSPLTKEGVLALFRAVLMISVYGQKLALSRYEELPLRF